MDFVHCLEFYFFVLFTCFVFLCFWDNTECRDMKKSYWLMTFRSIIVLYSDDQQKPTDNSSGRNF